MTTVLLIRHGRTSANTAGILAGRSSGVELDDVGRTQVADVGTRLGGVPLRGVVTSPLRRCRQTTQALVGARDDACPVHTDQGIIECGYGDWTGRTLKELSQEKLWATVQSQPSAVRFPGGESMTEMSARAVGTIRAWDARMEAEHGADAVWAAVSHGDVIKAVLADALGMHLDAFQRILVDPASVSIVRYTASRPYVVTVNSTNADLGKLLSPPPGKPAGTDDDAAVGGGLGASAPPDPAAGEPR
ncbi:2,3-bisphosphoglycerate-dependent phosphoglycerate mutase [Friedmanniella luteola]|uniref:2,3-bisphosphoglycerate-dependent phosphoglycerate mutase n=1 Tax=Friedmanniella luteola TaxID=546871 RepID=A0A1H1QND1_9ACTN|nr:histidine phosphatase family protein [Friedmanniella luteola]SDS24925.1 2,3-bisphosphoglycerate-dependent phosphoglycerate mutase [Friedmanniella luteola]